MKKVNWQKKMVLGLCLLAATGLAACGNGDDAGDTKKKDAVSIDSETIKDETVLEIYTAKGKLTNYVESAAKLYNEKTGANIKLEITNVASGTPMVQMVTPKLVSQEEMPDIITVTDAAAAGILEKFEDSFYSASDFGFYEKYGSDFYEQKLDILKAQTSDETVIPWVVDFTPAISFYQPEKFKAVGINFEDIKSWDEYIEVAKKVKEKTGAYGIALPEAGDQEFFVDLMGQQDVALLDKDGNINLGTPEAKNAANLIKKMVDAGIVNFYGAQDGEKAFQESAMFVAGGWYAANMELNFPDAAGKWQMTSLVPFAEGKESKVPVSGGSSFYVPKKSKHGDVAQQFLSFMMSDEDCLAVALEKGVASSNMKAYDTEAAQAGMPYYNDQKYYELMNEYNKNTATISFPPSYSDATAYVTTAAYEYWKNGDYDASYLKEADNFAQKYGVKVSK